MPVNTKCQVFTPQKIVYDLLNVLGYKENLFGKKVSENSCGDGNILLEIVKRYIEDGLKNHITLEEIKNGLEKDIFGIEIDRIHILNCKLKLDNLANCYGLNDIKWNIIEGDFLKLGIKNNFDYVIGNPPYITYKEISLDNRDYIREKFSTCKHGKFDYCYAFIEASINSLKNTGRMAYLVPSNIFKNQFALDLRTFMLPYLTDIYDYTSQKLFAGKLTSSSIIVCAKYSEEHDIMYHNTCEKRSIEFDKSSFSGKWMFDRSLLSANIKDRHELKFGDYFHAASSIATLLNKAYIISKFDDCDNEFLQVEGQRIEKAVLRKAVSPRSLNQNKQEYIIFPYYYSEMGLRRYSEKEFSERFPLAEVYLKRYKENLDKRNSDERITWFEYGRSQALRHMNQTKLLISTLITKKMRVATVNADTIPTSGLYIIPKEDSHKIDLEIAAEILNSEFFLEYVKTIGVISNGRSFRISPKDINNFVIPEILLNRLHKGLIMEES